MLAQLAGNVGLILPVFLPIALGLLLRRSATRATSAKRRVWYPEAART